ncbi:conserved Plasmodium membrane protein, unknown function [Plasmodium sp. gorilla clade G2]|uniref:conserved Plasmodium membrane protein, unknown function n=1 Tax=Plasmodium sp. gorilla clade G2 TaxID=880535 RepID=UPI000D22BDF0|nr:conserved Plasmodium membrane protein, unknown function [Plasmodium sp. gorilla clade G2]SOV17417.1 conserved Plasmodium membrane protein, unknown function [Plasmodium sp. gorilla clade G2]
MEKTSFKNNEKSYSKRHSSLKKKVTNDKNDNSLLTIYSFISNYMLKEEVNYDENDNRYILLESQDFENESGLKKVSFGEFNEKSYSLSHKRKKQNEEDIDKEEEVYENVDQADYEEEDYEEEDYEEEDYEEDDYEEDDYEEEDYEEDDYQDDDYQYDDYQLNDDEDAEKPYNYDPNQIDSKNVNNDHSINSTNIKQNNSIIRRVGKKKKNKIYNNDNFPNEEDIQIDHNMNEENHSRQLWKKKRKKKRKREKKNMYTNMKNKEIDNNKKGIYKGNNLAKYFTLSMENINEQENIFKDEKQLSRQMSYYNDAYYYTSEMIYKNNRRNKEKFALYLRLMSLFINIIIGIYLIIYFPHTNNDKDTFDGTFKNMDIKDREDIKHIISKNLEINKDYHNYMKKVNLNVSILNKQKELFENKSIINGKANTNTNTNTNSSNNNRMHVNAFDRNSNNNDSVINTNNTNNNNNNSNNFVRFLRNIFSSNNYEQEDNLKSLPNSINKEKTNNNTSITNTGYYNLYKNNNNNNNIIDVEKNIYDENDKNNNLKKKNLKNVKSNNYNSGVYYVNDKDMLKDIKTKEDINNLIYMIDILNLMDDEHIMIYIYNEMNKIYKYAIYSFFGELLVISIIVFSLFILKILINDNNKFSVILTMYGIFYKIFCYIFAHYVLFMGLYILSIYYNIYIHRDIYTHSYNFFCYHYVYNNLYIHLLMLFYALQNIVFTINDAFNCIRMVFILIKHVIIKIYEKITCKNFITFYELKEDKSPLSLTCFNKLKNKCNMNCKCCKDKNCVEIDIDEMHDLEYEKNKLPLFPNFNRKPYCKNLNIKTYEQSLLNMRNPIFK